MSGRLLKKVLKEQELKQQRDGDQVSDDESDSPDSASAPAKNPFDLLNEEADDGEEDNPDQEADEPEVADSSFENGKSTESTSATSTVATTNPKSKKKKKKRKKGKEGVSSNDDFDLPFEVALETLSISSSSNQHRQENENFGNFKLRHDLVKQSSSVLQIDPKCLNVENELRRIFGSKVVKSFDKSNQSSSSRQRAGRRGSHHIRKTVLVSPSDHWPRWDGSFSMEFLESKDGIDYFRYVHSPSYGQAQRAFEAAQAIHDLNGVANVLLYHPYHLDSLITMADYFKFAGEHQMSADAIAKCLYALECAWHPTFTPFQGNCQLKFSHEANKPLFKALFTHMKNMDRRGCHRSALEVCKLLLALDSDDPMGTMFCIDYFALRAGEYAWLEQFSEDYKSDNSLWMFPNFSYSLAVCRCYLEKDQSSVGVSEDSTKATSADLMKQALMLHPNVPKKLVAKVPLKDQAWTKILKSSLFCADQIGIPSLDHLVNIYAERSYLIWRLPDLQKLLRDNAVLVIEAFDRDKSEAKDWACVRKETFSSKKNEYAHLAVQDFSDTVPTLPPDNLQNFMADMREARQMGVQVAGGPNGDNVAAPREVANRNMVAVLLESMLPWVNYGNAEDGLDGVVGDQDNRHEDEDY